MNDRGKRGVRKYMWVGAHAQVNTRESKVRMRQNFGVEVRAVSEAFFGG